MKKLNHRIYDKGYFEKGWRSESGKLQYEDPAQQYDLNLKIAMLNRFFPQKGTILFVGTAKGFEIRKAREHKWEAFGTDFSEYAIKNADPTIVQYLKLADTRKLPHAEDQFDVVAGFNTVEHIGGGHRAEIILGLREISRVAKTGILLKVALRHWVVTHCYDPGLIQLQPLSFWIREIERLGKHLLFHAEIGTAPLHIWLVFYHKDLWQQKFEDNRDAIFWKKQLEDTLESYADLPSPVIPA